MCERPKGAKSVICPIKIGETIGILLLLPHFLENTTRPALLAEFEILLHVQAKAIAQRLDATQPMASAAPANSKFDAEAVSAAVSRLRSLLEASEGAAEEAFATLQSALAGHGDKTRLNALNDAIRDFEFEPALAKLAEIAQEYNLN